MENKVFMVPDAIGGGNQVDPNLLLTSMMNNGGFGGGNWIWMIFLFFLYGWRGNGFGNEVGSSTEREMLMQAIHGNGSAINNLASNLNCDINSVKTAINSVQSAICNVGNQVGLTGQQVINAIQQGNMNLASQLSQCCCDNKLLVTQMGYENRINNMQQSQLIQNGFAQVGYAGAEHTCAIKQNATDNTNRVLAKLDAIEDSRKDREINALTAQLAAATARAERQAELAPITKALADIQGKQPSVATVPYPNLVGVPASQYFGAYGNYGAWS